MKKRPHPCKLIQSGAFSIALFWLLVSLSRCSVQDAPKVLFRPVKNDDIRLEFYAIYQKVAAKYDTDYSRTRNTDLNVMLVLVCPMYLFSVPHLTCAQAGLLSAVSTAFIVDVSSKVEPPTDGPPRLAPTSSLLRGASMTMYWSLGTSLMATFFTMVDKERLSRYSLPVGRSMIERCRRRQRNFDRHRESRTILFMAPLLYIYIAILLVMGGLCPRAKYTHPSAGLFMLGVPLVAVVNYYFIISSARLPRLLSQTRTITERKEKLYRAWHSMLCQIRQALLSLSSVEIVCRSHNQSLPTVQPLPQDHIPLPTTAPLWLTPPALDALRKANIDDGKCVLWVLRFITDPEALDAAIRFATVIRWYEEGTDPEETRELIVSNLEECFDFNGTIPHGFRDRAYYSIQALTWIRICWACIPEESPALPQPNIPRETKCLDHNLRYFLEICVTPDIHESLNQMYQVGREFAPADIEWASNALLHLSWGGRDVPGKFDSITKRHAWGDWSAIPSNAVLNRLMVWCVFLGWDIDEDALRIQAKSCVIPYFRPANFLRCCYQ